jgi:L-ascorbate metabolism protein UlaG (beta-lactamase superfamily)
MMDYAGGDPHRSRIDIRRLRGAPKADLILVTKTRRSPGCEGYRSREYRQRHSLSIRLRKASPNASVMKNSDVKTVAGIHIEAVPAYNLEKPFHSRGNGNGYVLTFGDKRIYVAGDTENVAEIKALKNIDVAFLPMNQPYTMTPEQVADVAKAMRPKVLYPYHFGNTDTGALVDLLKGDKEIEVRVRKLN